MISTTVRIPPRAALAFVVTLCVSGLARAHDFWLEPTSHLVPEPVRIAVRVRLGDTHPGEPVSRDETHIGRFEFVPETGRSIPLVGIVDMDPAGYLTKAPVGRGVLVYESQARYAMLPARKFDAYLAEESFDEAARMRREQDEEDFPGREVYFRCAKSLLACGDLADASLWDRRIGLPLELVVDGIDESDAERGRVLIVRLCFRGEPLPGRPVRLRELESATGGVEGTTDSDGRVHLPIRGTGRFLLRAVHMLPDTQIEKIEWRSYWASSTFELRANREEASTDTEVEGA